MKEARAKKAGEYNFNEAYEIRGRGVGRLDMQKAVKSDEFVKRVRAIADQIESIETPCKQ